MTDPSSPQPGWAEAAAQAGTDLGLGTAFPAMQPADWDRVCRRAGQILAARGEVLSPGWERGVARAAGRSDPADGPGDQLARDEADTVLAEEGEVFAPEDDA
ncbi:hypothetical protein MMSR116_17310 [Methylobacterium mesophilicum SR1.6/6]|uniref:Uncharacterized protein n=1 Tax=Methylobacterium mesophilicum SR1.6/6 TaxID=908290 RepID=A0A6B9FM23_9HYPH|nr:hypothetical protein [Methylobacterium mesophilicum]QGY03457.1 hypothetical protein MMSR116_17310 [Methylobacterium mesophilicum SR1.6/6]